MNNYKIDNGHVIEDIGRCHVNKTLPLIRQIEGFFKLAGCDVSVQIINQERQRIKVEKEPDDTQDNRDFQIDPNPCLDLTTSCEEVMQEHIEKHHSEESVKCDLCEQKYPRCSIIKIHTIEINNICKLCYVHKLGRKL